MAREKLPVYANLFPDGRATLTCSHCAIDAELEGARATTLYAEESDGRRSISWETDLTAEQLIAAATDQCMHLSGYRT